MGKRVNQGFASLLVVLIIVIALIGGVILSKSRVGAAEPSVVTIQNGKLFVNGAQFEVRGVNYNPNPNGSDQLDATAPANDVPKIAALGANTIGTYSAGLAEYGEWSDLTVGQNFYNALYPAAETNNVKIIVGYYSNETIDWTDAARVAKVTSQYQQMVNGAKVRPSTLAYLIGNEIFEKMSNDTQKVAYAKWIGDMVNWTHSTGDPSHPVMYADRGDSPALSYLKTDAPALDIYAVNNYSFTSSSTLTSIINGYANAWVGKAIFLHEWGTDSLNYSTAAEDLVQQGSRYITLATAIHDTYSQSPAFIGATSFEFTDEWRFVGSSSSQDKDTGWTCASCFDGRANEDYWGLMRGVSQGASSGRQYKQAYYDLQSYWNAGAPTPTAGGATPTPTATPVATATPGASDTVAPTVSITSPANGTTVNKKVTIVASASDNVRVTKVEFYVDGIMKRSDNSSPYNYSWDPRTYSTGAHTIMARAYDAAGNTANSSITLYK